MSSGEVPEALVSQEIEAVRNAIDSAGSCNHDLAVAKTKFLRGFIGPVVDHVATSLIDLTIDDLEKLKNSPSELTAMSGSFIGNYYKNMPSTMTIAEHARSILSDHGQHRQAPDDPARAATIKQANQLIDDVDATYYQTFYNIAFEGASAGLMFPLNMALAYRLNRVHQLNDNWPFTRQPLRQARVVENTTNNEIREILQTPSFKSMILQGTIPKNGFWGEISNNALTDPESYTQRKSLDFDFLRMIDLATGQFSEEFVQTMIDSRRQHNAKVLGKTGLPNKGIQGRLSVGCPVARPHTGAPNVFETGAIAVLDALGASQEQITAAFAGQSIMKAYDLAIQVCEVTASYEQLRTKGKVLA